jgi:hypothetical protein
MRLTILSALAALAVAASPAARADDIYYRGKTTATPALRKDVLKQITDVGVADLGCDVIDTVEFKILPSAYAPDVADDPSAPAKETYEKWTVTMCGHISPFLVGFWRAPDGAAKFRVIHPFPDAANGRP